MANFPTAAGYRDIGASGVDLIPTYFSALYNVHFDRATVMKGIVNTKWQGEVTKNGGHVNIRGLPTITTGTYRIGGAITYTPPTTSSVTLDIDRGVYYGIPIDAAEQQLTDMSILSDWAKQAAIDSEIAIDAAILGNVYADAHGSNIGNTAGHSSANIALGVSGGVGVPMTRANVIRKCHDFRQVLAEESALNGSAKRWIVGPPWMTTLLAESDLASVNFSGDTVSMARNGWQGTVAGFNYFESLQLAPTVATINGASTTCTYILFGTTDAIAFASVLVRQKVIDNPNSIGELVQGLRMYGYRTVKPEALGVCVAAFVEA